MAETTGPLRLVALAPLVIVTILGKASALHAQVGETEAGRTEAVERAGVEADGTRAQPGPKTGFPTGYWIEFDDNKDWLRLTSGEWLHGDLNWMRNGDFEFDGDKTDLMRKGWSNVDQLHSPQVKTYVFRNRVDAMGRAMVTRDEVIVETEDGIKTFPRSELISILKGGQRERDWWVLELGVGFTGAFGNSNQSSLNADFGLGRHDQRTSTVLLYEGTFGAANREVNVNRHLGQVGVTLFLSDRFYLVPAAADFFHDRFANIKFRATPAALGGVQLFDTNRVEWDLECGLGYQFLRVIDTLPTVPNPQSDGFIPVRTYWEFDITGDIELDLSWQSNIVFTTIGNTNHMGEATFTVEITDIFNFKTEFEYFRTEQPLPREDGSIPKSNDFQLIVGFSIRVG
jgi:putative salt-induced outer membrane protein YdiY